MTQRTSHPRPPVAIVGMDVLFPGTPGRDGFWRDIIAGRDAISDVPESHWLIEDYYDPDPKALDKTYCRRGGFLGPVPFDPLAFGIPPSSLPSIDTAQLLALVVAKAVLDEIEAPLAPARLDRSRISVVLGVASATEMVDLMCGRMQRPAWVSALREAGLDEERVQGIADRIAQHFPEWQESTFPGLLGNVVAGRIANRLDLGGSNFVTDAACASSFAALQAALDELYLGRSDTVLTGGVDALNDILMYMCFSKTPAFSKSGDIRPFSDRADGTIIGEGLGLFALRRLADAERDGNRIYAVIRGVGRSSDGRSTSVYAPRPEGQAAAIARAYEEAGYKPDTVDLVEAHGTGTIAGDAAEVAGLKRIFGPRRGQRPTCALGSIKSQIGHTKAAAGSAGLFKTAMALHQKALPPTLKVDRPNPKLGLDDSPFYLNTEARPWIAAADRPRRAAVSSFGFGGSNFHVTLEEYCGPGARPARTWQAPASLVLLSAPSADDLAGKADALAEAAAGTPDLAAFAAFASRAFRPTDPWRLALTAGEGGGLGRTLAAAAAALRAGAPAPAGCRIGEGVPFAGRVAFLFPGQGSQYLGMGAGLALAFEDARAVWDRAAALTPFAGWPLHELAFPPHAFDDAERERQSLRLTDMPNAQPTIAAVSLAQLAVLRRLGLEAHAVAGHSFGEVTALAAARAFSEADTLMIARLRGEAMATAAHGQPGAMLAVRASRDAVQQHLARWSLPLVIANDNAPEQVVLSGPEAAIADATAKLAQAGITAVRLPVASAFHSPIVAASAAMFAARLASFAVAQPAIPVYGNATAEPYPAGEDAIRRTLAEQIARPVRFREQIAALYEAGVRLFVEVGPGSVLSGLTAQCLAASPHHAVALDRKGQHGAHALLDAVAAFAALGLDLDYGGVQATPPADLPVRVPPPAHTVTLLGTNYGKPYPPPGGGTAIAKPNPDQTVTPPAMTERNSRPRPTHPASETGPAPQPATEAAAAQLDAFHRRLAETHAAYQAAMTESHTAFLRVTEQALAALTGRPAAPGVMLSPDFRPMQPETPAATVSFAAQPMPPAPPGPVLPLSGAENEPTAPGRAAVFAPDPLSRPAQAVAAPHVGPNEAARRADDAAAAAAPAASGLGDALIAIVSDKTGYPADMLRLDMELEAELGIDSIKQVEILSAFRDRFPGLPAIEPAKFSELRTLGRILEAFGELGAAATTATAPVGPQAPAPQETMPADADMTRALITIVSEKTGYPADMLRPEMELEAELGIDSIKQVEILSAFRDRFPGLPEIAPATLSELRSLGAIVAFLGGAAGGGATVAAGPAPAAAPRAATTESPGGTPAETEVPRFAFILRDQPASGVSIVQPGDAPLAVVSLDGTAIAEPLARELSRLGVAAQAVTSPAQLNHPRLLLLNLEPDTRSADRGAVRAGLDALSWARGLAARAGGGPALFVTVQDSGGGFAAAAPDADRAWLAGLAGLARTARREWPAATVKAIDINLAGRPLGALARALAAELLSGGPDPDVALGADGGRRVPVLGPAPVAGPVGSVLSDGAVVVVTGGARGITAQALSALVRKQRLRIALLGRTALCDEPEGIAACTEARSLRAAIAERARASGATPDLAAAGREADQILAVREVRATLAALGATGSEVRYLLCDVQDESAVNAALNEVRRTFGPIEGLIHGAGVLADSRIADKTPEQAARVLATKLGGLAALLSATAHDPLRLLCLFSSASAAFGNAGQADYAMANAVLDSVAAAESARRPDAVVKAIAWGPWDGGMVTPTLKAAFAARGIETIGLDAGAAFFVREIALREPAHVVAGTSRLDSDAPSEPATVEPPRQTLLAGQ